jgi:hypothetical protein
LEPLLLFISRASIKPSREKINANTGLVDKRTQTLNEAWVLDLINFRFGYQQFPIYHAPCSLLDTRQRLHG